MNWNATITGPADTPYEVSFFSGAANANANANAKASTPG